MRQITSLLREAATRRRLIGAGNDAGGLPATYSTDTTESLTRQTLQAARFAACWVEVMSTRLSESLSESLPQSMSQSMFQPMSHAQQPAPPLPRGAPAARASSDFTAQVMARLSTPAPEPDPRETRTALMRAHARRVAGVYISLLLVSGVAVIALAIFAPWLLLGLVAAIVSVVLIAMTFATFIGKLTGGVVSGFGVAYLAMLATLTPPLLLLARRSGRGHGPRSRRL